MQQENIQQENVNEIGNRLLKTWCEALLRLQISNTGNPRLDGAILCPACGIIHGRCWEAMYPFLCLAATEKDDKWIKAAEQLFQWAIHTVSQPDGSFLNDIDSDWKGTTVFGTIQLADCLLYHSGILTDHTRQVWKARLNQAAQFLYGFEELNDNNINYPISNALALYECGLILEDQRFILRAEELAALADGVLTENGLLFGEGAPRFQKSPQGCRPIDIGYNVEETLPSLAIYGHLSGNEKALAAAEKGLRAQLEFMLENGAWDNSFGTRNFKWTYWGSRTSDGCALGYLLLADRHPEFALAAKRSLLLLSSCTVESPPRYAQGNGVESPPRAAQENGAESPPREGNGNEGLLAGGPHYAYARQEACVHHTFTHAKVLAGIVDRKLGAGETGRTAKDVIEDKITDRSADGVNGCGKEELLPRQRVCDTKHYPELATWLVNLHSMTATITAYDWEYLPGGHVSGGTLSLLHHNQAGTLLCAGMSQYSLKEPKNMQVPDRVKHECLALRIEVRIADVLYSSMYEDRAQLTADGNTITARGHLKDSNHRDIPEKVSAYTLRYMLEENKLTVEAEFIDGLLICPLVSHAGELAVADADGTSLVIMKEQAEVRLLAAGKMELPYGTERIFQLAPGLQAIRVQMAADQGNAGFVLEIVEG